MVFGHAPIVLPAVLRVALPHRSAHYARVLLLHVTLLTRVVADLAGWPGVREAAGVGNVAAVLAFAILTALSVRLPSEGVG